MSQPKLSYLIFSSLHAPLSAFRLSPLLFIENAGWITQEFGGGSRTETKVPRVGFGPLRESIEERVGV